MFVLFSKVKPYRDEKYNYFDMFILFNLTLIAVISNSKLRLTFFVDGDSRTSNAIMGLLWVPLVTWLFALCVIYWKKIFEKLSAIYFCLRRHYYAEINNSVRLLLIINKELTSADSSNVERNRKLSSFFVFYL